MLSDIERSIRRLVTGELVIAFLLISVLIGVFTNAFYSFLTIGTGTSGGDLLKLMLIAGVVAAIPIMVMVHRLRRERGPNPGVTLGAERVIMEGHRGLVLLVSKPDTARFAIRHHLHARAGNRLEHCWLIWTTEMKELCSGLETDYSRRHFPWLTVTSIPIAGAFLAPHVRQEVLALIEDALDPSHASPMSVADLIVDITGGTKPMTAGAVLASTQRGISMQYVESTWRDGRPVEGTQVAKIVEVLRASPASESVPPVPPAPPVAATNS